MQEERPAALRLEPGSIRCPLPCVMPSAFMGVKVGRRQLRIDGTCEASPLPGAEPPAGAMPCSQNTRPFN